MRHAGAEIGPAVGLVLRGHEPVALRRRQRAARRGLEGFEIERGLLLQAVVEEVADGEIAVDRLVDLRLAHARGDGFDHQRVELGVLHLFHPVMLEQALELRIERAVVVDRFLEVPLAHPFDVQDRQRHRQRMMREDVLGDRVGGPDDLAVDAESPLTNSSRKRRKRWMCLASSPANSRNARAR